MVAPKKKKVKTQNGASKNHKSQKNLKNVKGKLKNRK